MTAAAPQDVFAFSTNANDNAADGQAKAVANCTEVHGGYGVNHPWGNDNNGKSDGNAKDPKSGELADTHVTNCDKYWTNGGFIGNPD